MNVIWDDRFSKTLQQWETRYEDISLCNRCWLCDHRTHILVARFSIPRTLYIGLDNKNGEISRSHKHHWQKLTNASQQMQDNWNAFPSECAKKNLYKKYRTLLPALRIMRIRDVILVLQWFVESAKGCGCGCGCVTWSSALKMANPIII